MTISIKNLERDSIVKWDEFVIGCGEATFFHRAGWKRVIEQAFGHDMYYLYAEENGSITGVLPLGHIKSILFGNSLVSNPFCVYGGIAANTDSARTALYKEAGLLASKLGVDHLELRNLDTDVQEGMTKELYVTFRKNIDPDPDVNMKAIPRKQRAMVRKGIKAGLQSEVDQDIERFFKIYSLSVRNHGTPVFSKKFFKLLKNEFKQDCEISTVLKDGCAVSSVMSFYFRNEVLPYYGGGTPAARKYKAFDFMYWDVMSRACQNGIEVFDYGRSKIGTGSYSFKKNWGFEPKPLNYEYKLVKAAKVPDVNPLNPKYQLFIKMWRKLPLPVANSLGPLLARSLG